MPKRMLGEGGILAARTKTLHGLQRGSPIIKLAWGQQYNIGEIPNVILCTSVNRHAVTPYNSCFANYLIIWG